mgnify:CR=1 FL=1
MISRIPIKYLLPLILLLFSFTATTLIYFFDRAQLTHSVEKRVLIEAKGRLSGIQGTLELLIELGEVDGIARQLAAFSALPDNRILLLTDAKGVILASNHQADRGRKLDMAHPDVSVVMSERVISRRSIETQLSSNGNLLDVYASVCSRGGSALRLDNCGLLYHRIFTTGTPVGPVPGSR